MRGGVKLEENFRAKTGDLEREKVRWLQNKKWFN